jgi:site-specific recombinase XerD
MIEKNPANPAHPSKIKLSKATRHFLEHCEIEKNQSKRTLIGYAHYLERFMGFAGDIEIEKIDMELVKQYRLFLNRIEIKKQHENLSLKTQNIHIIALRSFLKHCAKNDWETLPPEKVELAKQPDRMVEYLSREEL